MNPSKKVQYSLFFIKQRVVFKEYVYNVFCPHPRNTLRSWSFLSLSYEAKDIAYNYLIIKKSTNPTFVCSSCKISWWIEEPGNLQTFRMPLQSNKAEVFLSTVSREGTPGEINSVMHAVREGIALGRVSHNTEKWSYRCHPVRTIPRTCTRFPTALRVFIHEK